MPLEILLIDDEPSIRRVLEDSLSDAGHHVTTASDGAEAVAHIDRSVFDVVISDIRLPHVNGMTIFHKLRQEAPKTDVILMTA